jgi:hypothetical protein
VFARAGKTIGIFVAGYLTCAFGFDCLSRAGAAAGATPSLVNGDVNGDTVVNLTDAVYLLNYLFASGAPPAENKCEGVEPSTKAKVRFGNAILCGPNGINATVEMCGVRVSNASDPVAFNPSACMEIPAGTACPVRVSVPDEGCGTLEFCTTLTPAEGDVFDFVLFFDQVPLVGYFKGTVDGTGQCPTFPSPAVPFTDIIQVGCPAGIAALTAGEGWKSGPRGE